MSLYHQSDVLWHNGTNYKELLFSSDIWAGYVWQASGHAWLYMSRWPDVVLLLSTRCLYWGEQKMYVDQSLCACFSCVILLLLQQQQQQQDWVLDHWTEMYVDWSCCSCCSCFSCIILLLLQQQNYTVTAKATTTTNRFSYWQLNRKYM